MYDEVPGYKKNQTWKEIAVHDDQNIKGFFGEYSWLSNFHPCKIVVTIADGMEFSLPSVENAYQAMKFDQNEWHKFENITAYEAKKLARKLPGFTGDSIWLQMREFYMHSFNLQKYLQHPELKSKLLATGDKYLEETNYWRDQYWGVCNGVGANTLGKILMDIRKGLR